ncbi:DUF707 domain-containing protein [Piscinibacter sp. XHJ-5]|uniref:DUF707 domain-containing protein n=1 Tax=Piscinibacter sp. XHJ-5 TaxID=3037797 RepID=UPI002452F14F|nr:DUF707 domain-containing protein [Piscinibacter sp. XHJ-5]
MTGLRHGLRKLLARVAAIVHLRRWVRRRDARDSETPLPPRRGKYLYAAPIGESGKAQLEKLLARLDPAQFDFLIFVYDGYRFDGEIFSRCRFIHEQGIVYHFFKKYVTPELAAQYDVIFLGVEDVEIDDFDSRRFLDVMKRNRLDMAAPALSGRSITPHRIMYRRDPGVGRLVDVIEIFLTAFDARAWPRFWALIDADRNHWGWGYVQLAQSCCEFKMGLVDCETVSVLRPPTFKKEAQDEMHALFARHPECRRASFVSYGKLR